MIIIRPKPLHPAQVRILRGEGRFKVVAAGRRFGKTTLAVYWLLHGPRGAIPAHAPGVGYPTAIFAPTYKLFAETWERIVATLLQAHGLVRRIDRGEKRIELTNGGVIDGWTLTDPIAGRGRRYAQVVIDEAAFVRHLRTAWENAIAPTLADMAGEAWFISTPNGRNYFYELYLRGQSPDYPEWASYQAPSHDNPFIAPNELERMRRELPTRVYRQEVLAEFVSDREGALWRWEWFERPGFRVFTPPELVRVVVGVDPAVSEAGETGIVVVGVDRGGEYYVLGDYTTSGSPDVWVRRVVAAYDAHEADVVVAEVNQGGDMVRSMFRALGVQIPIREVRATRGKAIRAEPVAALYEAGRVHHLGNLPLLEAQLTSWAPEDDTSPDRMDALVWAISYLYQTGPRGTISVRTWEA